MKPTFTFAWRFLVLTGVLLAGSSLGCWSDWPRIVDGENGIVPPGHPGRPTPPPGPDAGVRPPTPETCHHLAPAPDTVEIHHHRAECPLTAEPLGGTLRDGTYTAVATEICKTREDVTSAGTPVRIRISGQGTRLEWTANRPIFSAEIAVHGSQLRMTETCRDGSAAAAQPPHARGFTAVADRLTLYDGLWVMVFEKESEYP
jgi:hypothetical protein